MHPPSFFFLHFPSNAAPLLQTVMSGGGVNGPLFFFDVITNATGRVAINAGVLGVGDEIRYPVDADDADLRPGWNHIMLVRGDQDFSLYLNGVLKDFVSVTGPALNDNVTCFVVGATPGTNCAGAAVHSPYPATAIDDVVVFSRELSDEAVQYLADVPQRS